MKEEEITTWLNKCKKIPRKDFILNGKEMIEQIYYEEIMVKG